MKSFSNLPVRVFLVSTVCLMAVMANVQLLISCAFLFVLLSMSHSDDTCLQILPPVENMLNASVDDWINRTFSLHTDNCSHQTYIISVERTEQSAPDIICRIYYNKTSCFKTGNETMYSCRCLNPWGPVEFWEKLVSPTDVEYKFRWTEFVSKTQGEKTIHYHVESLIWESLSTSSVTEEVNISHVEPEGGVASGDESYRKFKTISIFLWAVVGFFLLFLAAVVFFLKRCIKRKSFVC